MDIKWIGVNADGFVWSMLWNEDEDVDKCNNEQNIIDEVDENGEKVKCIYDPAPVDVDTTLLSIIEDATNEPFIELMGMMENLDSQNINLFGEGGSTRFLSAMETLTNSVKEKGNVPVDVIKQMIKAAKKYSTEYAYVKPEVVSLLNQLSQKYRVIIFATGNCIEQNRYFEKAGFSENINLVVLPSYKIENFRRFFAMMDIEPEKFLMLSSTPSDDIPNVLKLGGNGAFYPENRALTLQFFKLSANEHLLDLKDLEELKTILDV